MKINVCSCFTLAFVLLLSSCQISNKLNESQLRDLANQHDTTNRHEAPFKEWFQRIIESDDDNMTSDLEPAADHLARIMLRSQSFLYQFDQELEQMVQNCEDLPREQRSSTQCDMTQTDTYLRLQAQRTIRDNIFDYYTYSYMQLLDLANSSAADSQLVFPETTEEILANSQQRDQIPGLARGILTQWRSWLNQRIEIDNQIIVNSSATENREIIVKTYFERVANQELFRIIQLAEIEYQQRVNPGRVSRDIEYREYTEVFNQLSDQIKDHINDLDVEDLKDEQEDEIYDSFRQNRERSPDSSQWVNHTGRNFPANNWALTYDDGPAPSTTLQIIDLLKNENKNATFFWLAKNAKSLQNVVRSTKKSGMGLAHHSYTHANIPKISSSAKVREIVDAKKSLESVYGQPVTFFRLPYGAGTNNTEIRNLIANNGMQHFFWNVDSLDWQDPNPESIKNRVIKQMRSNGRGIILLHDIHTKTVRATQLLLNDSYFKGVRVENLATLVGGGAATSVPTQAQPFRPHYRVITASSLNVRSGGSTNNPVCGTVVIKSVVEVVGQDPSSGWFELSRKTQIDQTNNDGCPDKSKLYMSNLSKYSRPQ